jgi:iron(III) transport system substrate-binding protein
MPKMHVVGRAILILCCALSVLEARVAGAAQATSPKLEELYAKARQEGIVSIWGTNAEDLNWISQYFGTQYPGIDVRVFTDINISARLITENRAGHDDADVIWNSEALVQPLLIRGLLDKPDWATLQVGAKDVGANGYMAFTNSLTYVVAYNTKFVRSTEVPRHWDDLLKPEYRGKMVASPFLMSRLSAALGVYRGEQIMADYARRLRDEAKILWTNDLLEQVIRSGERSYVSAIPNHYADRWIANGISLGYVIPEPAFITQFGSVIAKKAPHPNAARLLVAWLSSPEGRRARERKIFSVDLRAESGHPKAKELRDSGKEIHFDNTEARDERNRLIPIMDRILAGLN